MAVSELMDTPPIVDSTVIIVLTFRRLTGESGADGQSVSDLPDKTPVYALVDRGTVESHVPKKSSEPR